MAIDLEGGRPETCGNCRYWHNMDGNTSDTGMCRKNAPSPAIVRIGETPINENWDEFPVWPNTLSDEWYGEWKARDDD